MNHPEEIPDSERHTLGFGPEAWSKIQLMAGLLSTTPEEVVRRALGLFLMAVCLEESEYLSVVRDDKSIDKVIL